MILRHDIGRHVELADSDKELPRWRYVYAGRPKPFFQPLCTPAGYCLPLFEPHGPYGVQQALALTVGSDAPAGGFKVGSQIA